MVIIMSTYGILIFYVPRITSVWAEMDGEFSLIQRLIVQSSHFAANAGIITGPFLLLYFMAALAWRIHGSTKLNRTRTKQAIQVALSDA
jgi:type II secretory pathway component PulF